MFIQENVPLQQYSTMRLGGSAAFASDVNERQEIPALVSWAVERKLPVIMVGGGSNIVWRDDGFNGLLLINKLAGLETYELDDQTLFISAAGGENWDKFVEYTIGLGLSGIELLSLIPGTVGAAPVQNIGAYGCQLSDVLSTIEAYDLHTMQFVTLRGSECEFGYRVSRFKSTDRSRFLITKVTVQLSKTQPAIDAYHTLQNYLDAHNITDHTPKNIREAVIAVRNEKLPDPAVVANCGSFFANPVVDKDYADQLLEAFPKLAGWHSKFLWDMPDGKVKIAAGALLEHEGFKGFRDPETGMATWDKQALVLVNEHAKSTADLLKFKQKIVDAVKARFGIILEQEPELLP
jgi:UDP-N-acetylmuramate dehydrogenase